MINDNLRFKFFGSYIDPLTMDETLERIEEILETRIPTQHVVINVAKLVLMQKDEELRRIVNSCGLINADGKGIVWGAKMLGKNIPERVAGIDLFQKIVELASQKDYRLYFFGAKDEILNKVIQIFKGKYPDLQIAGFRNGYFKVEEEENVVKGIRDSKADILFVAISSPKKEFFLNKYVTFMGVPFVMGVGGSFDVIAGYTKRAPIWMQKAGLEWFFRLMCEPKRMWKRYLVTNTIFAWMLLKAILSGKRTV